MESYRKQYKEKLMEYLEIDGGSSEIYKVASFEFMEHMSNDILDLINPVIDHETPAVIAALMILVNAIGNKNPKAYKIAKKLVALSEITVTIEDENGKKELYTNEEK